MPFTHVECMRDLQWPNRDISVWPAIQSVKPEPDEMHLNKKIRRLED